MEIPAPRCETQATRRGPLSFGCLRTPLRRKPRAGPRVTAALFSCGIINPPFGWELKGCVEKLRSLSSRDEACLPERHAVVTAVRSNSSKPGTIFRLLMLTEFRVEI